MPVRAPVGFLHRHVDLLVLLDILPIAEIKTDENRAWVDLVDDFDSRKVDRANYLANLSVSCDLFADRLRSEADYALTFFHVLSSAADRQDTARIVNQLTRRTHPYYQQLRLNIELIYENLSNEANQRD